MQLLKALVIGMGVLIILAVGMLAYGLLSKTKSPPPPPETMSFEDLALSGNAGCRIENATPDGQRLVIELAPASGAASVLACEKIIIIDMNTGAIIGGVALQP